MLILCPWHLAPYIYYFDKCDGASYIIVKLAGLQILEEIANASQYTVTKSWKKKSQADGNLRTCKLFNELAIILLI